MSEPTRAEVVARLIELAQAVRSLEAKVDDAMRPRGQRGCTAMSGNGTLCERTAGHDGEHRVRAQDHMQAGMSYVSWGPCTPESQNEHSDSQETR